MTHFLLKGIDFIEANLEDRFTLADVARAAGYSPFHYSRLFLIATGDTVMGYARKRRLSRAAAALMDGTAGRLIDLAFDCGFESQAAFTRAFKRQFGVTPGAVRKSGRRFLPRHRPRIDAEHLRQLSEGITMEPTFIERGDILFVGLTAPVEPHDGKDGTPVWRRFRPLVESIHHRADEKVLGVIEVIDREAGNFAYSAAAEVTRFDDQPDGLTAKTLPGGRFAVFTLDLTSGDIGAEIRQALRHIYGTWVPNAGVGLRAYYDLEVYDGRFNPKTLTGQMELWVPVR